MLKVCKKGDYLSGIFLTPDEDRAVRRGFGRFSTLSGRAAGAAVIQHHQHQEGGRWLACDCLDGQSERPPILVPVLESFIRRHTDEPWPAHAEDCDFFREPAEQRAIARSYSAPSIGPLRLIKRFGGMSDPTPPLEVYRSYAWRREGLATMLRLLQVNSGLNCYASASTRPKLGDQYRLLRGAAAGIQIDDNVPLSRFLCTYAPALPEFMEKVGVAPARQFKGTRPHGIFLAVVTGVANGRLLLSAHLTVPVRGKLSIFGEHEGHMRETPVERSVRAPYLAACLVARPRESEPVCVIKAYVHPCVSLRDLMLVDSNYERRTLGELKRLQQFLAHKQGIRMMIEKPMMDIRASGDLEGSEIAATEPCIPDFILHTDQVLTRGAPTVLVETMGFSGQTYRSRKAACHEIMVRTLTAPLLQHDFHFPKSQTQAVRDRQFWSSTRWSVTGSGPEEKAGQEGTGSTG